MNITIAYSVMDAMDSIEQFRDVAEAANNQEEYERLRAELGDTEDWQGL